MIVDTAQIPQPLIQIAKSDPRDRFDKSAYRRVPVTDGAVRACKEATHMLFAPKEKGQGLVEYALILVLVAVVVIVILVVLGPAIGNVFSNIVANI
jgi:pilus assembly protein Flp/PilA